MSRITVESLPHIDVNELNRLGAFARPMEYPFMGLRTWRYLIEYRHSEDWLPQRIPVQWTYCHFGGWRPWLTCLCGSRVGKLYYGAACLACRHCAEAIYESQRKGPRGRLHLKATRIRARLGDHGRPGIDAFPPRPLWFPGVGMQRKTYARIRAQGEIIERKLIEGRIYRPRPRWEADRCHQGFSAPWREIDQQLLDLPFGYGL
jgi:hypothetical protein